MSEPYYFINDFNDICRQKEGMKFDESEIIELHELIDDINHMADKISKLEKKINIISDHIYGDDDDFECEIRY